MSYNFKKATIHLFDIHPAYLMATGGKNQYTDPFKFLGNRNDYCAKHISGERIPSAHFKFRSLLYDVAANSHNGLDNSHFWKSFKEISPDVWSLQIPFIGTCNEPIHAKHNFPGIKITVSPSVFLTAIGWSANLKLSVEGVPAPENEEGIIKKSQLINLIASLDKDDDITPGKKGSSTATLSFVMGNHVFENRKDLFVFFRELIKNDVYNGQLPHGSIKIFQQCFISIDQFSGKNIQHRNMPTADQVMMRSILYGCNIDPAKLADEEKKFPLLPSYLKRQGSNNFMLTDFERGTFVFLQDEANSSSRQRQKKIHCVVQNCKNMVMMSLLLWQYISRVESLPSVASTDFEDLRRFLPTILKELPKRYSNVFCRNFFQNHAPLNKFS